MREKNALSKDQNIKTESRSRRDGEKVGYKFFRVKTQALDEHIGERNAE